MASGSNGFAPGGYSKGNSNGYNNDGQTSKAKLAQNTRYAHMYRAVEVCTHWEKGKCVRGNCKRFHFDWARQYTQKHFDTLVALLVPADIETQDRTQVKPAMLAVANVLLEINGGYAELSCNNPHGFSEQSDLQKRIHTIRSRMPVGYLTPNIANLTDDTLRAATRYIREKRSFPNGDIDARAANTGIGSSFLRPLGQPLNGNPEYIGAVGSATAGRDDVKNNSNYLSFENASPRAADSNINEQKRKRSPEPPEQSRKRSRTATAPYEDGTMTNPHEAATSETRDKYLMQELKQTFRLQAGRDKLLAQVMKAHPEWSKAEIALLERSGNDEDRK